MGVLCSHRRQVLAHHWGFFCSTVGSVYLYYLNYYILYAIPSILKLWLPVIVQNSNYTPTDTLCCIIIEKVTIQIINLHNDSFTLCTRLIASQLWTTVRCSTTFHAIPSVFMHLSLKIVLHNVDTLFLTVMTTDKVGKLRNYLNCSNLSVQILRLLIISVATHWEITWRLYVLYRFGL